ncbi:hypothetical protein E5CHR_04611 [Variovorax sp. PBL-E5]|nr:hypothetical protein SRS16CHR_04579 [Variovorax sp. SRS16]VTU37627.1 hypothetical protein E5CHR_04611 [Variovorax sp. PBL-E5]
MRKTTRVRFGETGEALADIALLATIIVTASLLVFPPW